jgi:dTDP-4-dehydrorhamnose 3,5-epimerase
MQIEPTDLPEVLLVTPRVFRDARGFFQETFNARSFEVAGLPTVFPQDNHSRSGAGVLRGLHYQLDQPQGKLIRVVRGRIADVALDIRVGSPTFGRWCMVTLSDDDGRMLWIPPGFAHGFCVLSEGADVCYKCTALYSAADDRGILWRDPGLAIPWPISAPVVSEKDERYAPLHPSRADLPRVG